MKAFVINGHVRWPQIAEGKLNKAIFDESIKALTGKGYEILETAANGLFTQELVFSKL